MAESIMLRTLRIDYNGGNRVDFALATSITAVKGAVLEPVTVNKGEVIYDVGAIVDNSQGGNIDVNYTLKRFEVDGNIDQLIESLDNTSYATAINRIENVDGSVFYDILILHEPQN